MYFLKIFGILSIILLLAGILVYLYISHDKIQVFEEGSNKDKTLAFIFLGSKGDPYLIPFSFPSKLKALKEAVESLDHSPELTLLMSSEELVDGRFVHMRKKVAFRKGDARYIYAFSERLNFDHKFRNTAFPREIGK